MTQMDLFSGDFRTVAEARKELMSHLEEGPICPCCDRMAQIYKFTITAAMARGLIWFFNNTSPGQFVHIPTEAPNWFLRSNSFAKNKYWLMVEEETNADTGKKRSGSWRITDVAERFVCGQIQVPKYHMVYNDESVNTSNELLAIREALGKEFDYRTLMEDSRNLRPVFEGRFLRYE